MRIVLWSWTWLILSSAPVCLAQQWQWLNPKPQGDNIRQIQFVNPLRGWVVVESKSLLHTTDGGVTWRLIPTNVSLRKVSFINDTKGWGIGSAHPYTVKCGIYHTSDGGRTWQQQLPDTTDLCDDIKFTDASRGWAIGRGLLWHTSNGGLTWYEQADQFYVRPAGGDYAISFRDSFRGWAGGWQYYASKTFDGGRTWVRDSSLEGYNRYVFVDSLHGWASSTFDSWTRRMIARTTDGGLTWVQTPASLRGLAHPVSPVECVAFADNGVYKTTDAGASWVLIHSSSFKDGYIQNASTGWAYHYFGSNYFQTIDGGYTWTDRTTDVFAPGFTVLWAVDFVDTLYGWSVGRTVSGFPHNNFVGFTTNGGLNWTRSIGGLESEPLALSFVSRTIGWIVGRTGMIRKTTDGGFTWQQQPSGTTYTLWDVQFLDSLKGFAVGTAPPGEASGGVVLKTINGGTTWIDVSPSSLPKVEAVQFVDESHGWVCGDFTGAGSPAVFLRTTDGGNTWSNPLNDPTIRIDRFYFFDRLRGWGKGVSPDNPNIYRILATTDGGSSWAIQLIDSSAGGLFGGGISFHDSLRGWIVGGGGGMRYTSDGGNTWLNKTGATSKLLNGLGLAAADRAWVVGYGGAILALRSDGIVSVPEEDALPRSEQMDVFPNYPNPFNSQTRILYRLPRAGAVTLELYDIIGRRIKRMDEGYRELGEYTVIIHSEGLTSGVYFYKLTSGQHSHWGKIVLIR